MEVKVPRVPAELLLEEMGDRLARELGALVARSGEILLDPDPEGRANLERTPGPRLRQPQRGVRAPARRALRRRIGVGEGMEAPARSSAATSGESSSGGCIAPAVEGAA